MPIALVRIENMPKEIFAKLYTCKFFYIFICLLNIPCDSTNVSGPFVKDHSAGKHINSQLIFVLFGNAANHLAESIAPSAISVVAIIYGRLNWLFHFCTIKKNSINKF